MRRVAAIVLPREVDDLVRILAGLARAYPGAVLGDLEDPRTIVVNDPYTDEEGNEIAEPDELAEAA